MNHMLSGRIKPVYQMMSRNHRAVLVATGHVGSWPEGGDGALADQTDADLQGHMIRTRRHPWNNTGTNSCVVIEQLKQA